MTSSFQARAVALTAHARTVMAPDRERFADALRVSLPAGSVLIVTCHRVEAYATMAVENRPGLSDLLPAGGTVLVGAEAARHLVSVAVGRDSALLGENEILHQVRGALASARRTGPIDPAIDRLFALALRAGRRARSWQQGPRRSLGDVAVDRIAAAHGELTGRRVLVVGAGKMGGLVARAAIRAGASVTIANRSPERACVLADAVGADVSALDPGASIADLAGVVVALSGPWPIGRGTATALEAGRALVVDLSFPASVLPSLARRLGERLVTADRLAVDGIDADRAGREPSARVDALINAAVEEYDGWLARGDGRAAAKALVRRADDACEVELEALWRRMPALEPDVRTAIEEMTRHLAARLLQDPLERLGSDPDGRNGRIVRELFAL